jgi:hypothetical protein
MPEISWVTDAVRLFGMFTGDREKRAAQLYELLSTHNTLGESSLYLNAGYWDGATRYDDACQRLAEVLGEAADLRPGCAVLDCDFGERGAVLVKRCSSCSGVRTATNTFMTRQAPGPSTFRSFVRLWKELAHFGRRTSWFNQLAPVS